MHNNLWQYKQARIIVSVKILKVNALFYNILSVKKKIIEVVFCRILRRINGSSLSAHFRSIFPATNLFQLLG